VKNDLFHRAEIEGADIGRLYEQWWRPFEADWPWWREEVGRGHAKRPRIDIFLQNYLTRELRDEVKLAHIYDAYKEVAAARGEGGSEGLMKRIRAFADLFRFFNEASSADELSGFFRRMQAMEMNTANPFLLEVFARFGKDASQTRQILRDVESFLVRRMVCHLSARSYGMHFVEALKVIEAEERDVPGVVRRFLLKSETDSARWPSDAEFRDAWMNLPFGKQGRARVELLLLALETKVSSGKTEKVRYEDVLTVEHLMPRTWSTHWAPPSGDDPERAAAERNRLVQTIGNLTLLTDKLNPAVSNGPWREKLPEILKHSILKLNLELPVFGEWGESAIRSRGERLFQLAREAWPRPLQQ